MWVGVWITFSICCGNMITCKQLAHFEHVKIQWGVDMRKNLGVGIQLEYCLLLYVSQGYSLSGHCSVLLLSTIFDHYGSPSTFYIMWLVLGGFSAMRMVSKYYTDCNQKFSAANFKILQVTLSRKCMWVVQYHMTQVLLKLRATVMDSQVI